jgi:integrase
MALAAIQTLLGGLLGAFPRRLDAGQLARVSNITVVRYQEALSLFHRFLLENKHSPHFLHELDTLLLLYKEKEAVAHNKFVITIASIEFHYPKVKGSLQMAKASAAGDSHLVEVMHTTPLTSMPARLFAIHVSEFKPRLGLGITLQQATGLRPSELLKLQADHVLVPPGGVGRFVLRLGARIGTKVKREQVGYLDSRKHPTLTFLLLELLAACDDPSELLFPYTYAVYRSALQQTESKLGLRLGITPHSPRAGFATEAMASGIESVQDIRDAGRWLSDSSVRVYVDVVSASSVQAACALAGHREAMSYAFTHFLCYFSTEQFRAEVQHGARGLQARSNQRSLPTSGDGDANSRIAQRHHYKTENSRGFLPPSESGGNPEHGRGRGSTRANISTKNGALAQVGGKGEGRKAGRAQLRYPKGFR